MYLIQTVSATPGPRTWSSYTNIHQHQRNPAPLPPGATRQRPSNFLHDDAHGLPPPSLASVKLHGGSISVQNLLLPSHHHQSRQQYRQSPSIGSVSTIKTAATTYDFPENPRHLADSPPLSSSLANGTNHKDGGGGSSSTKKWSFSSLFRRRSSKAITNGVGGSDSSGDDDAKSRRRRRKSAERKRKPTLGTFDHIVVPPPINNGRVISNSVVHNGAQSYHDEAALLSDPSGGFNSYLGRPLPQIPQAVNGSHNSIASSLDSNTGAKKTRRERSRTSRGQVQKPPSASSSDDDDNGSHSSSRLRSEENLRHGDSPVNRRSRAARTERYIRRLSKDEENILNREAAILANRNSHVSCSSTVPPKARLSNSHMSLLNGGYTMHQNSPSQFYPQQQQPYQHQPQSVDFNSYTPSSYFANNRSVSYEADIHRSFAAEFHHVPQYHNTQVTFNERRARNRSLGGSDTVRYPPVPPPRDPKRIPDARAQVIYANTSSYQFVSHKAPLQQQSSLDSSISSYQQDAKPASSNKASSTSSPIASRTDHFQYLADKKPRSRKPIVIAQPISISSVQKSATKKAVSPQMFTAQSHVRTNIFLPSVVKSDLTPSPKPRQKLLGIDVVDNGTANTTFKPISISPSVMSSKEVTSSVDSLAEEIAPTKRKSTNLEEALDELEAIYKSLHLGDEDLLERAEQREMSAATEKLKAKSESYPVDELSFNYETYDSLGRKKRLHRRSQTFDRRGDDMAYRKMTRERSSTIGDPQSIISYLLTSPVHSTTPEDMMVPKSNNEPDITLDDVVFRNVKHANDSLKVNDPQPFGIPTGPISPAPQSDYLHAVPEDAPRYTFHRRKIPDVVKDDLAYRNLRKDSNKEPALRSLIPEDVENNNADLRVIRKKRAVRSLSANINNLLQRDAAQLEEKENNDLEDIADAMEIARQILKEKEEKITANRRAFMSDSETKYKKYAKTAPRDTKESISESRMNFLNNMKSRVSANKAVPNATTNYFGDDGSLNLESKPPKSITPERRFVKEATPVPKQVSPVNNQSSLHSSLEELLTAFAAEAREASDRANDDLQKLDEDQGRIQAVTIRLSETPTKEMARKEEQLAIIDLVSQHAKQCEQLLEAVVDSTELITLPEPVRVETVQLPEPVLALIDNDEEELVEPDYVNVNSSESDLPLLDDIMVNSDMEPNSNCKSPFEEHKAELIASFQELGKMIDDACHVADEVRLGADDADDDLVVEGEPYRWASANDECCYRTESHVEIADNGHVVTYVSNCTINVDSYDVDDVAVSSVDDTLPSLESLKSPRMVNSLNLSQSNLVDLETVNRGGCSSRSSSLESIIECVNYPQVSEVVPQIPQSSDLTVVKLISNAMKSRPIQELIEDLEVDNDDFVVDSSSLAAAQVVDDLELDDDFVDISVSNASSSPKIVQSMNNETLKSLPTPPDMHASHTMRTRSTSSALPVRRHRRDTGGADGGDSGALDSHKAWYRDPMLLAVACYYGFACTYQLATLDAVTLLGLLFVIVSVIAALIL